MKARTAGAWIIHHANKLKPVDGHDFDEIGLASTLMYCDKIGISENEYLEIIKTAYQATGDYHEGMFDL
jgi:hypothetical protein